ncbi:MAG TPA: carbohydrate ABC transporter permease [Baekduia sp.]|uniref:carbohydrate ABC transporter permease n=1 Tax=Baekduia sp. TaxID=2600305 RepID=UPI002D7984BE|nr:carbohydrate ABC transporter permease [Baekduia sp.]HET6508986.1 carbohydrate ABC transporter permease [Baekduia sp.]
MFRYTIKSFGRELTVLAGAAVFAFPVYVLVVMALKGDQQAASDPLGLPSPVRASNLKDAWEGGGTAGLGHALTSSLIITIGSVVCLVAIGSLCAYAIARRPSRLGTGLYILFMVGIMLPLQLGVVPLFVAFRNLGLTGSYVGMIVLYTGLFMPFTVFLYTGFIRALPKEYEEAAQVDGAGLVRTYLRVVFPLLRPITGTVGILAGLLIWNDFFVPLVFLSGSDKETLPLALYSFVGENTSAWNLIMAAVVISIAPIMVFYLFAQRQLIKGFAGGLRG